MKTAAAVLAGLALAAAYHAGYTAGAGAAADADPPTVLCVEAPDGTLSGFRVTGVDRPDHVRAAGEWRVCVNDATGNAPDRVFYCVPAGK